MNLEKPRTQLPLLSRIKPPALVSPGFPNAEPSVFSLRKPDEGGFQPIRIFSLGGLSTFWGRENFSSIAREEKRLKIVE